jgi:hypothetical protein
MEGGGVAREDGPTNQLALSLSLANACNPYCKRILLLAQDNMSHSFSPCVPSRAKPIWARARSDNFTRRSRDPPGSKRRQLARQVGACCVLTNNFPMSSIWVVSNNLFSSGRCSISGVSSSFPSTAATTWCSFPPQRGSDNDGRQPARRRRTWRRLPPVAEEQHPGLSHRLPRRRRRRRGNHGQAGGSTSSAVERVDGAGTPSGVMSGVALAPGTTTSVVSPQHANPKRTDDASTLAEGLLGVSLVPKIMV